MSQTTSNMSNTTTMTNTTTSERIEVLTFSRISTTTTQESSDWAPHAIGQCSQSQGTPVTLASQPASQPEPVQLQAPSGKRNREDGEDSEEEEDRPAKKSLLTMAHCGPKDPVEDMEIE